MILPPRTTIKEVFLELLVTPKKKKKHKIGETGDSGKNQIFKPS